MWNSKKLWGGASVILLGTMLLGCGGEGSAGADMAAPLVLRVEGMEVPQSKGGAAAARAQMRTASDAPVPARIVLKALPTSKTVLSAVPSGPRMVGEARAVAEVSTIAQMQQQLQWRHGSAGNLVSALSISAQDALGLRLGVVVTSLPASAVLRVYSQLHPQTVFVINAKDVLSQVLRNTQASGDSTEARTWWTPEIGSGEVTLEIELPAGTNVNEVQISVPVVSHIFADLRQDEGGVAHAKINESDSCNKDAVCDGGFSAQSKAVARMLFTRGDGKTYVCTGTLLNDAKSSGTPYFLSANHCISTQTVASSLQTDWFYRASACNSRALAADSVKLYGGATLLHASSSTDVSFMRLNDPAPAGAYFAGWDASGTALPNRSAVVGLHHPVGDMLKISKGEIATQTTCMVTEDGQFGCVGNTGNFYALTWSQGTTQGGSSGSALFSSDGRYVVGNLFGGGASCTNAGALDFYGRFDVSYAQALKNWLGDTGNPPPSGGGIAALDNIVRVLQSLRSN